MEKLGPAIEPNIQTQTSQLVQERPDRAVVRDARLALEAVMRPLCPNPVMMAFALRVNIRLNMSEDPAKYLESQMIYQDFRSAPDPSTESAN